MQAVNINLLAAASELSDTEAASDMPAGERARPVAVALLRSLSSPASASSTLSAASCASRGVL